jgi:predicted amino acid racemase
VTAPRLEIRLDLVERNTRVVVDRLAARGIRVSAVTKATLGSAAVARAFLAGGATGLSDSRVENIERLREAHFAVPHTLLRSPMVSQVARVVASADISLSSEPAVLVALADAARVLGRTHAVVLMVELGDLREGAAIGDVVALARMVVGLGGLTLAGLGTNLACQCGVVPDQRKMDALSDLVEEVETAIGERLTVVSGGNSANLDWALTSDGVGRVDELRLGEALLLGREPLHRRPIDGLSTTAFTLVAEVIEVQDKPAQPWGDTAQAAFAGPSTRSGTGTIRQALVALGRQDTDPDGITPPPGLTILGASSDHLVLDAGDHPLAVGDEVPFDVDYSALVRAMTSPFISQVELPLAGGPC